MEKYYFECVCGHSVLAVDRDEWDEYTNYVSLVIYGEHTPGWKGRLRHVWSIVKYGHPWSSTELLLLESEAERLGRILIEKEEF